MLVLSRRLSERILIGDGVVVTVVSIDRGKVRLGIDAPPEVKIYREELVAPPPPHGPDLGGEGGRD